VVARLNAGKLILTLCLIATLCFGAGDARALIDEARQHLASYKAVIAEMEEARNRQDGAAYENLGKKSLEHLADAGKAFEASNAAGSDDPEVVYSYAEVMKLAGNDDLGAEMVEQALARGVESPGLWRIYGEMCLASGPARRQDGVDALRKSTELDGTTPASAEAWFALGRFYLENEMPEAASKVFASALAADPAHVPSRLGDAAVKIYGGDIAGAGAIIEEVGKAAQPYDVLLRTMVRAALLDFDRARRSFADTVENHYAYARLTYIAARFPEAVLAAKRAGAMAKDRTDILNFLGAIQIQSGDIPGAIEAYEASLRAQPDQAHIQQTLEQMKKAQQESAQSQQPSPQVGQGVGPLR
jgi:tetratricopeptide (TPR) repeat protein